MKIKSQRQLQIGENIKRIIAEIFLRQDITPLKNKAYITVLEADISPDIKQVKIFLDIFGSEEKHKEIIKKLNKMAPFFRYELGKKLATRNIPEIKFALDTTGENVKKINNLIDKESNIFN
jgi:ribosome-binding factor A